MTKTRSLGTRRVALLPFLGLNSSIIQCLSTPAPSLEDLLLLVVLIPSTARLCLQNVLKVLVLPAQDGANADEVEVSDDDVEDLTAEPEATGQTLRTPDSASVTATSSVSSGFSGQGGMAKRSNRTKSASDSIRSLNMGGGGLEKWRPKNKSIKDSEESTREKMREDVASAHQ